MTVYFIFYVIIIVFGLFVGDRRRGLYVGISFLLLFALIALRHPSMGFDLQYGQCHIHIIFCGKQYEDDYRNQYL